jgi:ubiquinone/menaquinone biosynthesis C-methylase UbiE
VIVRSIELGERSQPKMWMTRTYDRLAGYYDLFMRVFVPVGEKGRERIVERLSAGSVPDVACGTGTLLAMGHEKGLECYGIDLSEGMLNQARAKVPSAELRTASYYEIPYPDGQFDYVVASSAISGTYIDARRVLSEMIRVCKSGGGIYIAEWPKAETETLVERFVVWMAGLGYEPESEVLSKRHHIFGIERQ